MKQVSFTVAKALKEAGYPQYGHCEDYYDSEGWIVSKYCEIGKLVFPAPTYVEVWLWLWSKGIKINVFADIEGVAQSVILGIANMEHLNNGTPEAAIIAAIEFLVNNDLIK